MIRPSASALLLAATVAGTLAGAAPAHAQRAGIAARGAPQYVSYTLDDGTGTADVAQLAIPLMTVIPITQRLTIDLSTAYATSRLEVANDSTRATSTLSGLTDTQLRGSYVFGNDAVVLTAGLSIPTGTAAVPQGQAQLASFMATDLLTFPVPVMGAGLAATGGVAVARTLGAWNLGAGASLRYASEFDAFQSDSGPVRFQPGNEYRLRLGADRALGAGRLTLGFTVSAFGEDRLRESTLLAGNRYLAQLVYSSQLLGGDLLVGAYNLFIGSGRLALGDATSQNITNAQVALGYKVGKIHLEPNVETRVWINQRAISGVIGFGGLRARVPVGPLVFYPGGSIAMGNLDIPDAGSIAATSARGLRGSLAVVWER